jgi:hypothetical protein
MRRWVFNTAAAVSLLLCTAIIVLWVRSSMIADFIVWSSEFVEPRHGPGPDHLLSRGRMVTSSGGLVQFSSADRLHIGYVFVDITAPTLVDGHWTRKWTSRTDRPNRLSDPTLTTITTTLPNRLGFRLFHLVLPGPIDFGPIWEVVVPFWFLALITGILPVVLLVRFVRSRLLHKNGCCLHCGYDLTANTSGVCPECGKRVPQKPEAVA